MLIHLTSITAGKGFGDFLCPGSCLSGYVQAGGCWGSMQMKGIPSDTLRAKPELPPCDCMPPPTSQVAVYIHVCPDSFNICSEDFEGIH